MKHFITLILFTLLSACGADTAPQLSKLPNDAVILAFGDSLTNGNGAERNNSYPAVLAALSGRTVINDGISGEESGPGLKRLPAALEQYEPELLILCHGGNDMLRKKNLATMESNIRQMIKLAQDKNIPVVLLGVPKPGLFPSTYEGYKTIAESNDVIFIDDLVINILKDDALKSDSVHPNKDGYRVMAETIYTALKESGAL